MSKLASVYIFIWTKIPLVTIETKFKHKAIFVNLGKSLWNILLKSKN